MSAKTEKVAQFEIDFLQFLDENHQPTQPFPDFAQDRETLLTLYRLMSLTRALDHRAVNLQRTGKMGTYPSTLGQEAVGVGMGHAMHSDDVLCPYYRDQATFLARGLSLEKILLYWGGDERGSVFDAPDCREDFPMCVPIATQCLHATGIAYAMQYRKQKRAVLTVCGEGGTSKGDFYEAINLAGAWKLPVVFVVNNNQWAISVPRDKQTATQTIAQKAIAGGFEGLQVDGNDVIAVRHAVRQALDKARRGEGPTLIEAITYRLCDHTTADDASRYRPQSEYKAAWKIEPIARLGFYLEAQGWWDRDKEAALQADVQTTVNAAVDAYLATPDAPPESMMQFLYDSVPDALLDQYDEIKGAR